MCTKHFLPLIILRELREIFRMLFFFLPVCSPRLIVNLSAMAELSSPTVSSTTTTPGLSCQPMGHHIYGSCQFTVIVSNNMVRQVARQ